MGANLNSLFATECNNDAAKQRHEAAMQRNFAQSLDCKKKKAGSLRPFRSHVTLRQFAWRRRNAGISMRSWSGSASGSSSNDELIRGCWRIAGWVRAAGGALWSEA